jgi:hypothetical protein
LRLVRRPATRKRQDARFVTPLGWHRFGLVGGRWQESQLLGTAHRFVAPSPRWTASRRSDRTHAGKDRAEAAADRDADARGEEDPTA